MRFILFIIFLGMILLTGRTKDGKAEVVPVAPDNLTATVISTTPINLMWTGRSTNETEFKIERNSFCAAFFCLTWSYLQLSLSSPLSKKCFSKPKKELPSAALFRQEKLPFFIPGFPLQTKFTELL